MPPRFDYGELQRQAGEMREKIPEDLAERPGTALNDYYAELQERFAPEAARTALWDLIADQTIVVQQPGNLLAVNS
jgi:hypothetical protein